MRLVEQDCRLRVTDKPITPVSRSSLASSADTDMRLDLTTYYLCGGCGIVVGHTPGLIMDAGIVISCHNCGAHNEL